MFPPELRTLSVIPRWSVVWTLTRDTVSNHSYFVTLYARNIAKLIQWDGSIEDLMFRALVHDAQETITGDIPSPTKQEIIDDRRAASFIQAKMDERLPFVVNELNRIQHAHVGWEDLEAWKIVKAADRLDALIYLTIESRMGNTVIRPHLPRAWALFEAAWQALPYDKAELNKLWATVMVPAVKEHDTEGGWGL